MDFHDQHSRPPTLAEFQQSWRTGHSSTFHRLLVQFLQEKKRESKRGAVSWHLSLNVSLPFVVVAGWPSEVAPRRSFVLCDLSQLNLLHGAHHAQAFAFQRELDHALREMHAAASAGAPAAATATMTGKNKTTKQQQAWRRRKKKKQKQKKQGTAQAKKKKQKQKATKKAQRQPVAAAAEGRARQRGKHALPAPFRDKCWECKHGKFVKSHNNANRCRNEREHDGPDWDLDPRATNG